MLNSARRGTITGMAASQTQIMRKASDTYKSQQHMQDYTNDYSVYKDAFSVKVSEPIPNSSLLRKQSEEVSDSLVKLPLRREDFQVKT